MTDSDAGGDMISSPDAAVLNNPPKRQRRNFISGRLGAAIIGFFCGAFVWHLVGFWGFVTQAVFSGPREQVAYNPPVRPVTPADSQGDAANSSPKPATDTHLLMRTRSGRPYQAPNYSQFSKAGATPTGVPATGCTTLHQEAPGAPIRKIPCPVNSVEPLDLERELAVGDAPAHGMGGTENHGIETGSLPAPWNDPAPSTGGAPSVAGWATSLEVSQ